MTSNLYFRAFKLLFCGILFALCPNAAANSIDLADWGLAWGMTKDKFKLGYCSKIYEHTETCKIKTVPKNLALHNFYLLDFNPDGELTGFRYISKKLNETNALRLLKAAHTEFLTKYKNSALNPPDLGRVNFSDCVSLGECEKFALTIAGADSAQIEVSIAPANIPPFDIDLNTDAPQPTLGVVYIRYENSELGKISEKIKQYKFSAKNMKWEDFLAPAPKNYNLQLPYSPEEFNLSWGMKPQDMLELGIVCYELFKFQVCAPGNLKDFSPSLYSFTSHKNLGLVEFSFFHDFTDDESGSQGQQYFKQIVNNLLKKYKGAAVAKASESPGWEFCVAGNCAQESTLIHLNGIDEKGGTISMQRTINRKELKSNIGITFTRYLTATQKNQMELI